MTTSSRRSQSGATLIEILLAVVIIGVGFVAVLGGLGTSFALSAFHREQARAEAELRRYAEATKAASYSAVCPATYSKAGMSYTVGTGFTDDEPVVVGYVNESNGAVTTMCSTTTPQLHLVRLTVTSTKDTRAVETVDVVKRPM